MVVVFEEQGSLGPRAASHAQVSLRHEYKIALEHPFRINLAATHDRRLEPIRRPQLDGAAAVLKSLVTDAGAKSWSALRA